MNQFTDLDLDALAKLREPFPAEQIGKLPKGGIWLDFVGHGFLTQRLLDADPAWNWEPVAYDERGLPLLDDSGGLWIRLTVGGVTRMGYGDAGGRNGSNAIKEAIGDALRNAAMRFGAALDLWCKGDPDAAPVRPESPADRARSDLLKVCRDNGFDPAQIAQRFNATHGQNLKYVTNAVLIEAFTRALLDGDLGDEPESEAVA
jgi:hypothetical protein